MPAALSTDSALKGASGQKWPMEEEAEGTHPSAGPPAPAASHPHRPAATWPCLLAF